MPLTVSALEREFNYNGLVLADPNPRLSIAEVQAIHAATYPELATAKPHVSTTHTAHGSKDIVTFNVAVGTKG